MSLARCRSAVSVTNLCLVLGLAGAHASAGTVRLSGLASLLAGALSMAAG
ncbi:VIT1/CCC1 transporter family protein [Streptomyces sp. NPDC056690]